MAAWIVGDWVAGAKVVPVGVSPSTSAGRPRSGVSIRRTKEAETAPYCRERRDGNPANRIRHICVQWQCLILRSHPGRIASVDRVVPDVGVGVDAGGLA